MFILFCDSVDRCFFVTMLTVVYSVIFRVVIGETDEQAKRVLKKFPDLDSSNSLSKNNA